MFFQQPDQQNARSPQAQQQQGQQADAPLRL